MKGQSRECYWEVEHWHKEGKGSRLSPVTGSPAAASCCTGLVMLGMGTSKGQVSGSKMGVSCLGPLSLLPDLQEEWLAAHPFV